MYGIHWWDLILVAVAAIPVIVGFLWMLPDANRHGQPGWLWALLTIPFGWITIILYALVRAIRFPQG